MPNLHVNSSRLVGLRATADGSLLRTATLHNKEYIVVPIVSAVGDKVWWPANSDVPELVPADVLEAGYWSRNNRPIVAGHPRVGGEYVSANDPKILEEYCYGFTFGSKFEDGRVKVEGWFDPEKAEIIGPLAVEVINKLKNGDKIEVSEGNMVISEPLEGELDGQKYYSVWRSATNDHLATVELGACSNKMGCGGPRVSEQKEQKGALNLSVASNKGLRMKDSEKKSGMLKRMLASMTESLKAAMSNNELRSKLYKVVSEKEMGVDLVYDEDVAAKTFIYRICIRYGDYWDTYEYDYKLFRRSFEISSNDVTIGDDAVEVEWFEGWRDKGVNESDQETELVAASGEADIDVKPCSCHKGEKEETMLNANEKKNLITKLIGAAKSPFEESDRQMLEGMKDEKLTSLMGVYDGEEKTTETVATEPASQATTTQTTITTPIVPSDQVTLSKEEYKEIKASSDAHKAQLEQYRTTIISSLKSAQSAFSEDDLKGMTTIQLEKLATTLNVNEPATADYSVRGRVESRVSSGGPTMRELPDTWGLNN